MTSINIGKTVTTLASNTFQYCNNVTHIYVGENVVNITGNPFGSWKSNQTIYIAYENGATPTWNNSAKTGWISSWVTTSGTVKPNVVYGKTYQEYLAATA